MYRETKANLGIDIEKDIKSAGLDVYKRQLESRFMARRDENSGNRCIYGTFGGDERVKDKQYT